jgi:uncharacterized protein (TIGR03067 family)
MRTIMSSVVVVLAVALASAAADDAPSADLKALEGTWEVVSIDAGGMKLEPSKAGIEKAVVKDGKVTFFVQGKEVPTFKDLKLQIDAKKKPKTLDLLRGEKEALPCIYEVTGDEWKLAMPLVPKDRKPGEALPRPESFDSKDKPIMVVIAKRSKG